MPLRTAITLATGMMIGLTCTTWASGGGGSRLTGDQPGSATPPPQKSVIPTDPARVGTRPDGVGLAVGEAAPVALAVVDREGRTFRLADALREGAVLVVFYRGGWCPYCNFQVRELTESYKAFRARGVTPIVVSVDRVSEAAKTEAAYGIPFPVLSDPDLQLHRAFNVVFTADPELVAKYQGYGIDLEAASGRTHHSYAVPSIFLIGRDGRVKWAHADLDYTTRPTVPQLLAAIDALAIAP